MSYSYYLRGLEFKFGNFLTDYGHTVMTKIIDLYNDLFEYDDFSRFNHCCFRIEVFDLRPIYSRSYPKYGGKKRLARKIDELISMGHIENSTSQWSSPVHTKYINGNLELVVNYNNLNNVIKDFNGDMPTIKQVLNSIKPSKYFSKIVLRDGFRQLELSKNSRYLTAFDTDFGTFQWVTFPDGLKNNGKYLQYAVKTALTGVDKNYVVFYLGHILIFSNDSGEHLRQLKNVFENLRKFNLKIDPDQSGFVFEYIDYLGYQIDENGVSISAEKYNKILEFERPLNKPELRSFLGLISFYKKFVNQYDYESYTEELYHVLSSNYFYWNRNEENAFNGLKDLFSNAGSIWFGNLNE